MLRVHAPTLCRCNTRMRLTIESKARTGASIKPTDSCKSSNASVLTSVVNLIDLAGSESAAYTNIKSKEQKEMKYINTVN